MDSKNTLRVRLLIIGLGIEAVVLFCLALFTNAFQNIDMNVLSFPFSQIANGISFLAQKGGALRGLAVAGFAFVILAPLVIAFSGKKEKRPLEKIILILLSVVLGIGLYMMINPVLFLSAERASASRIFEVVISMTIWSGIVLALALRGMHLLRSGEKKTLMGSFSVILVALCVIFVATGAASLGSKVKEMGLGRNDTEEMDTNEDNDMPLFLTRADSLSIQEKGAADQVNELAECVQIAAPAVLEVIICVLILRLIWIYTSEEQSGLKKAAGNLSKMSCRMLLIVLSLTLGCNLYQLLFFKNLKNVDVKMQLPVLGIAFVVIAVLFSRLIIENKDLKDDNEKFI